MECRCWRSWISACSLRHLDINNWQGRVDVTGLQCGQGRYLSGVTARQKGGERGQIFQPGGAGGQEEAKIVMEGFFLRNH